MFEQYTQKADETKKPKGVWSAIIAGLVTLVIAIVMAIGWTQIPTGAIGVVRTAGKLQPYILLPGVYFYWFSRVEMITVKDVSFVHEDQTPQTKDRLKMVEVDMDVFVRVNPAAVVGLLTKYQGDMVPLANIVTSGKDVKTSDVDDLFVVNYNRIAREGRDALYRAFAEVTDKEINESRDKISKEFAKKLQKALDGADPGAFIVSDVSTRKLEADPAITKAAADRARAAQQTEVELLLIEKARVEAQRLIVAAQGQADANRILNESLTPAITALKLKEMELAAMREVAAKPGNVIMLGNGGTSPVVQLGK